MGQLVGRMAVFQRTIERGELLSDVPRRATNRQRRAEQPACGCNSQRGGQTESFTGRADLSDAELARAPDLTIGGSSVRLDGMRYRIHLDVEDARGKKAVGDLSLEATAGRLVPPIEITGARGWRTGYVVPVMSGALDGTIEIAGTRVSLEGGRGYHDHNWGFWQGVSWQWGQAQQGDLSVIYGRVFPPPEAADPQTIPGFVGVLGPDGPLGYSTDVRITEDNDERGQPKTINVRARGSALDLDSAIRRRLGGDDTHGAGAVGQRCGLPADARSIHRQWSRRITRDQVHCAWRGRDLPRQVSRGCSQ